MADGRLAQQATTNGSGDHAGANGGAPPISERVPLDGLAEQVGRAAGEVVRVGQDAAGTLIRRVGRSVQRRLSADLDDRDPDYIRENLPLSWLVASIWFRAEVRNLSNIPERGRVLLVG